jgi:general secretion pathway protein G
LIVLIILGVLATVVVFSVRGISDRGQESACGEDARILATAAEAYFANTGNDSIVATGSGPGAVEQTLIDAGFIRDGSEYWELTPDGALVNVAPC